MTISRRGFLGVTAAGAVVRAQDGQRPIFRVKVDMVVLSFQVTDNKGHYVNGLKPTDFKIYEDGILQQIATPRDLKERPANLFVGSFIGEPPMNVFPAQVRQTDGRIGFAIEGSDGLAFDYAESEIAAPVRSALAAHSAITVGIRPHAIRLGQARLSGKVLSNQWLGDQTHVAAQVAGRTIVAVAHRRVEARVGAALPFDVAAGDLHLFEAASGRAIAHGGSLA